MAKIIGSIAILWGRFPTLKEWAYVGYSLNLIGAAASHAFCGDSLGVILIPITILFVVLVSYKQWKTGGCNTVNEEIKIFSGMSNFSGLIHYSGVTIFYNN